MPNINSLTYNGMKSTDLGVYVTGSGSFDAAEMDADKYEIAGRNGDLIIPKNRYKNIVVTYPAFIPKAFQEKAQSIRNWMRSAKAYARLEDTYDMEHYRLGLASGIQSFEPVNRNDASNFQLSFDCKPQRFLKTGETPLPIEPEAHSYSGEIVSFETVAVDDMTKAEVSLSPIQSLNGYDYPWAGGAGKNLFRMDKNSGETLPLTTGSGVTFKVGSDKAIIEATGTASGAVECILSSYNLLRNYITIPAGTYTISVEGLKAGMRFIFSGVGHNGVPYSELTNTDSQKTVTVTDGTEPFTSISLEVDNGIATNTTIKIQIEAGTAKTSWTPYENICPITGHDSATLNIGAEYPTADETYPVTFPQTVYGGTFDWVSGKLVIAWKSITADGVNVKVTGGYGAGGALWLPSIILATADKGQSTSQGNIVSSYLIVPSNVQTTENSVAFGNGGAIIVLHIGTMQGTDGTHGYNSASEVQAAVNSYLQSNPLQIVYKLATPIEIDLTPAQVQTLLGLNNVWASDGTVEINYADPFNVDNPTYFEARPLFEITNPAQNDVLNVNGKTITFLSSYTGTVTIDCETMDCFSGYTNLNYLISATDFLVLNEGVNIVTWSGSGTCKMTPRWWEL